MALTKTTELTSLATLFSSVKEIYFKAGELAAADLSGASVTVDMELPVLDDGVSFDTGAPDVSQIKLTTGKIWAQRTKRGDSDISFNVASIEGVVNDLLLNKHSQVKGTAGAFEEGATFEGQGYDLDPKVVKGSLIMYSEDHSTIIALPNAHIVSSLNAADGDNPAYFKCVVTPRANSAGDEIFILKKK